MRTWALITALLFACCVGAQPNRPLQESRHGWYLSPQGTYRVLVIFAEIDWDVEPGRDPQPHGAEHWPKRQLPRWRDELFDPHPSSVPRAEVSRYYHDISLGRLTVLGDYIDQLVVLKESEHRGVEHAHGINRLVVAEVNKQGALRTRHGLSVSDFDHWKRGGRPGLPKELGPDDPHSYDHVMVILRNSTLTHGQGSVDPGSPGRLFGHESDSQSRFGAMNGLPFGILKHEFNHLFLGGNNFHSGGGNAAQFESYLPRLQGGWGMMGAASSSLLTCSAWDRDRLDWKPEGAIHRIRARDAAAREVTGDLDPLAGDTGLFVLRDFVTTGDALRIRLPFIPEDRHQQWLWVENHQGHQRNGSPTDRFQWELEDACVAPIEPGLFMTVQIARDNRQGPDIFGGSADHLRPVTATGNFDLFLRGDTIGGSCPFGGVSTPYRMDDRWSNPLSGAHEQELPVFDRDGDGRLQRSEHYIPRTRVRNGRVEADGVFFGRPEHAFRLTGNRVLGLATNPSSANVLTLVNHGTRDIHGDKAPNVRTVYLNGIRVELVAMHPSGEALVRVRSDDTVIDRDVRWCADSIVLPPLRGRDGVSLHVARGTTLLLDRSRTPTRMEAMGTSGTHTWYAPPTRFSISSGAHLRALPRSRIVLRNGSELHLLPGGTLELDRKARIVVEQGRVVLHGDARLSAPPNLVRKLERKGRLVRL
jgi:hypothetical protein